MDFAFVVPVAVQIGQNDLSANNLIDSMPYFSMYETFGDGKSILALMDCFLYNNTSIFNICQQNQKFFQH